MKRSAAAMAALAISGLAAASTTAGAQTLNLAVGAPVTSIDPHFHNLSPNNSMAETIFNALTEFDARSRLQPGLAESWRAVDEVTWEFKLRPGVRFHNGQELTADDVAFTFQRVPNVPNSPSSFAAFVRPIRSVEVVDPLTLRLRTDGPYPLLPTDLASVRILDRETHANATTEDFNSGRAAIGTGPFRFVSYRPGDRIELERNDAYFGTKPAWARVNYRMITNDPARTAALLAGDVDFIDQVATSDIARLRGDQRVTLSEITGLRIIYLMLDRSRDGATPFVTDNNGRALERNPLNDLRVRQALSIAIDRPAITSRVMEDAAIPAGQFLPEGAFGHVPDLTPPRHDVERARALLREAGFPDGFRITLHGPNDRYINDARIIQAIGQMWTRIGVRTAVEGLPWSTFVARAGRQEFSAFLVGWGSAGGEASSPLRSLTASFDSARGWGASNRGRYSNAEHDRLLTLGLRTLDDAERERIFQQATRVAMEDVGLVPIHIQKNIWGVRRGLVHEARADEGTRPQDVRPAAR